MEASDVRAFLLLVLLSSAAAQARAPRGRAFIPLMPPPEAPVLLDEEMEPKESLSSEPAAAPSRFAFLDRQESGKPRARGPSYARLSAEQSPKSRPGSTLLGFELGTVGRNGSTNSDALGMKLLWGGRLFLVMPVTKRVFLKPSLGFFYRRESAAKIGVSEFVAEGGMSAQYAFSQTGSVTWLVGAASRFEVAFSRTTISTLTASEQPTTSSDTSAPGMRFRLGPSIGMTYRVSPTLGLLLDLETTFSFTKPVKAYGGFVGGLIFRL
jgi:hypothetical protein